MTRLYLGEWVWGRPGFNRRFLRSASAPRHFDGRVFQPGPGTLERTIAA